MFLGYPAIWWITAAILVLFFYISMSTRRIGPSEVGLVLKRVSVRKFSDDNAIAFRGEPGYQADLLMPGLRWKAWLLYEVQKFPWVQVPAGEIGVVISQVGAALPIGAKSASLQKGLRKFFRSPLFRDQRRTERRAASGAASRHAGSDPSSRLHRLTKSQSTDCRSLPISVGAPESSANLRPTRLA